MENDLKIIRVFPRRTKATPTDDLVRVGFPDLFDTYADEIHISVTFKWDIPMTERLSIAWSRYGKTIVGGPALDDRGGDFTSGMYLDKKYVITSRGCPNNCYFCDAWKREGREIRELPIVEGSNVLDNNLFACSDAHVRSVFSMLKKQKNIEFTGGLEAARLKDWHVNSLLEIKPKQMFFAYDAPDDYEPLVEAGKRLLSAGFTRNSHSMRCFVLVGMTNDTPSKAQQRLHATMQAGFMPMAMYFRPDVLTPISREWRDLIRQYSRPAIMQREYLSCG
jgi:hypothetical protein